MAPKRFRRGRGAQARATSRGGHVVATRGHRQQGAPPASPMTRGMGGIGHAGLQSWCVAGGGESVEKAVWVG